MKRNWKNAEKAAKELRSKIKNLKAIGVCLKDKPEKGFYLDSKVNKKTGEKEDKIVEIAKCKSPSLRRYKRQLNKFYYLVTDPAEQEYILSKINEIDSELEKRPDGTLKK